MPTARGATVWSGEMSIANAKNQAVTTTFAIGDALPEISRASYLILAKDKAREGKDRRLGPGSGPVDHQH